ncbi:MAG: hypothetical protein O7G85_07695 [Planctomycetota bacterium]|nr:hypothetical protein [Planctomycetota bacterium]
MSWNTLIDMLFEIHDAHGHLKDFQNYERAANTIDRRFHRRATSRDVTQQETDRAMDQFQDAHTTRTLRRARGVYRHFTNLARSRPSVPISQRSEAGIAIFEAIRIHGLESDETWQARHHYARLISDYNDELLDEKNRVINAQSGLNRMKQYYLGLKQINISAANVYLNLCDNRTIRALAWHTDSLRRELLAASLAFEELANICAHIISKIDVARNRLDGYQRELNEAIRENRLQERMASNRYEPSRRDQKTVLSMA